MTTLTRQDLNFGQGKMTKLTICVKLWTVLPLAVVHSPYFVNEYLYKIQLISLAIKFDPAYE